MEHYVGPRLQNVVGLLTGAGLPTVDLNPSILADFLVCGPADDPVGIVGLEIGDGVALLRSLAVAPSHRGGGVGSELVRRAEQHAASRGVNAVYLLTPDAEGYFRRLGYERLPRERAPDFIRRTREYSGLCPASAAFMVKRLGRDVPAAD